MPQNRWDLKIFKWKEIKNYILYVFSILYKILEYVKLFNSDRNQINT